MTREEAIEILKEWRDIKSCPIIPQSWALDKIVSALEQEPCQVKNELNVELNELKPCDDAVSRRKAISVISACDGKSAQIEALEKLPPVTPSCDKCAMNGSGSKYCNNCGQKSGKWIYSDLLRVKHGTMNIDTLIDKVWAKMESEDV